MVVTRSRAALVCTVGLMAVLVAGPPLQPADSAEASVGAASVNKPAVAYRSPVKGPVIEGFRPPTTPYGPGNRGIDYATTPGDAVTTVADGEVTFAGQVGGTLHVVVIHADGVRSSLSFLASVAVRRGQHVSGGEIIGRAGAGLHLGFRRGEEYLDPLSLLEPAAGSPDGGRVRLVADDPARPLGQAAEADGLLRALGGLARPLVSGGAATVRGLTAPAGAAGAAAGDVAVALARRAQGAGAPAAWVLLAEAARATAPAGPCTPASTAPPGPVPERRRLVLVAGLGSSSTAAAVDGVDAAALGYRPKDVARFSYRGGATATTPYGSADTMDGIARPATLLRALLDRLAVAEPTVPIDVVAHSMGGLVARAALALGPPPRGVGSVVTLGTPHTGAGLAGGARRLLEGPGAPAWGGVAALLAGTGLDMASTSVHQLAPGSDLLGSLERAGPPRAGGRILAIGARTDLVVPVLRSRWPGQRSVVVDVGGLPVLAHGALPGSRAALRELGLLLGGLPSGCRSAADRLLDALAGLLVEVVTAHVAEGLATASVLVGGPGLVLPPRPG